MLWEQLAKEGRPTIPTQPSNTYASETPLSDEARNVTGTILYVDSGYHAMGM